MPMFETSNNVRVTFDNNQIEGTIPTPLLRFEADGDKMKLVEVNFDGYLIRKRTEVPTS